ncbi:MAG: 2-amino-4-hydroxy-6-hydroxymethyldihydropteridine diphosphokinase [bacterium]
MSTGDAVSAHLAFGSNLGNRVAAMRTGIASLRRRGVEPEVFSSLYHSAPKYVGAQPPFVNLVGRFRTRLSPSELLDACKEAERAAGRRQRERFGPRELDVDIVLYGERQVEEEDLVVPHPRMEERLFVLVPLSEIDPDLEIPGKGKVSELVRRALEDLPGEERVVSLGSFEPERGRPLDGGPV